MYHVNIRNKQVTEIRLRNLELPYKYNRNGVENVIYSVEFGDDGMYAISFRVGDGEIKHYDMQRHHFISEPGITAYYDWDEGWVYSVYVDSVTSRCVPLYYVEANNLEFVWGNDTYNVLAVDIFNVLLVKNRDITNPIVVSSIEEAEQYGLVWDESRGDVNLRLHAPHNKSSGRITRDGNILLSTGETRSLQDLYDIPYQYAFGL